jgi:hypothetical protein
VIVGRYAALWLLWLALANLAAALYFHTFGGLPGLGLPAEDQRRVLFALDTAALVAWELAARRVSWLAARWAPRTVAVASGTMITFLALHAIFDRNLAGAATAATYAVWLAAIYFAYTRLIRDVFILAGGCLSAIVVVTAFAARHLLDRTPDAGAYLLLALLVIAMAGAAGWWLKRLAAEHRA